MDGMHYSIKTVHIGQAQWLRAVILAIWDAEIERISVGGHPGKNFIRTKLK
jgi:hypothetical protein